ncbi:hypothetical protein BST11_26820 [Mycobacterium alsense]|uniref:Uncharacterized protein n=1 Tax=Mycobacterium alsense TaxID=324058 RepID=A0ABX3R144_9MYCO|nr:hypothetical protein BST11_26820 [Mycobacterium alsense]
MQQPAGLPVGVGCGAGGAVTDQRPPQQRLRLRVDRRDRVLSDALQPGGPGGLGRRVRVPRAGQGLDELA